MCIERGRSEEAAGRVYSTSACYRPVARFEASPSTHPRWRASLYRASLRPTRRRMGADKDGDPVAVEAEHKQQRDLHRQKSLPNPKEMHLQTGHVPVPECPSAARNRMQYPAISTVHHPHRAQPSLSEAFPPVGQCLAPARPLFPMHQRLHLPRLALPCGNVLFPNRPSRQTFSLSSIVHLTLAASKRTRGARC